MVALLEIIEVAWPPMAWLLDHFFDRFCGHGPDRIDSPLADVRGRLHQLYQPETSDFLIPTAWEEQTTCPTPSRKRRSTCKEGELLQNR